MHISALQIQGFGQLNDFLLEGLTPGLNVIYGPNGSGKSTLLQFVRGVLLGFDEARQLGLLPPRDWTPSVRRHAGGSIALTVGAHRLGIVRTTGHDQQDHLSVRVQDGTGLEVQQFRGRLQQLQPEFVKLLLAVGTSEAHSIEALLKHADGDGLPLLPTINESPEHREQLDEIRRQRDQLLGVGSSSGSDTESTLTRLDQKRKRMAESLELARQSVIARYRTLLDRERQLRSSRDALTVELEHSHLELQARQWELRTVEDALWEARADCEAQIPDATCHGAVSSTDVDQPTVRAQQMLLDLAQARHDLSCEIAAVLMPSTGSRQGGDESKLLELRSDRDQIDRCEVEVAAYLQQRLRRAQSATLDAGGAVRTASNTDVLPIAQAVRRDRVAALEEIVHAIREQRAACWNAHQSVSTRNCAAAEGLRRVSAERQALSADDGLDVLRFQLQVLDQEWQRIHEDWQALTLAESALTRTRTLQRIETPAAVIAHASQTFQRLTQGRYHELRYIPESGSLVAVTPLSESLQLPLLSRGTLDQAALSLRLAVINAYAERGVCWPVVLDEVLVDSDVDRLRLAATVLKEFTLSSQQVIYLTCLEHLVDVMHSVGANVLVMPGHQRQLRVDSSHSMPRPHWLSARENVQPVPTTSPAAEAQMDARSPEPRTTKQPTDGFWLRGDSPLSLIPSLSQQLVGRLASAGIRNVADLIDLDIESPDTDWEASHISRSQLSIWQAEARLLCTVPGLTGRDAQFLVAAGILSAEQLSNESADALMRRLDRLRGTNLDHGAIVGWPRHADLAAWITAARSSVPAPSIETKAATGELQFYLELTSPLVDAPSIGPTTARKLARIGMHTVAEFLNRDAVVIAQRLGDRRISAETVLAWQHQSSLMVRIPGLRGHDAQVLVACGIVNPETLSASQPETLFAKVGPFVATNEGRRLLRSARIPDLNEVSDWIDWARKARTLRAA